jgi:uncharacterized protein involved in tellurium resistance
VTAPRRTALTSVPALPLASDSVDVTVPAPAGPVRPFALLLDGRGRVISEFDLVFPGMPAHPSGAVRCGDDSMRVVPAAGGDGVRRIAIGLLRGFGAPAEARLDIAGTPFAVQTDPGDPVVVVAELVRGPAGEWRCRRAGYGLASAAHLATRFRAEPGGPLQRRLTTYLSALAPPPAGAGPVPAQRTATAGLIVGSVSLDRGEHAAVPRAGDTFRASLNWSRRGKDLDLYALYVDGAGREGACYYRRQGSLHAEPYICLTSGDQRGRETVEISRTAHFRYVLICAYSAVENGFGSFASFHAFVEVDNGDGSQVQVPLHSRNRYAYWVVIALVDLRTADRISVRHVERYSTPGSEARPVLYPDGSFRMDAGPVEFKTRPVW